MLNDGHDPNEDDFRFPAVKEAAKHIEKLFDIFFPNEKQKVSFYPSEKCFKLIFGEFNVEYRQIKKNGDKIEYIWRLFYFKGRELFSARADKILSFWCKETLIAGIFQIIMEDKIQKYFEQLKEI